MTKKRITVLKVLWSSLKDTTLYQKTVRLHCHQLQILLRAVPGKSVGGGTELKNGVTTIQFYLFLVQSIWKFQETPPPTEF
jgi:hypothetical protein